MNHRHTALIAIVLTILSCKAAQQEPEQPHSQPIPTSSEAPPPKLQVSELTWHGAKERSEGYYTISATSHDDHPLQVNVFTYAGGSRRLEIGYMASETKTSCTIVVGVSPPQPGPTDYHVTTYLKRANKEKVLNRDDYVTLNADCLIEPVRPIRPNAPFVAGDSTILLYFQTHGKKAIPTDLETPDEILGYTKADRDCKIAVVILTRRYDPPHG